MSTATDLMAAELRRVEDELRELNAYRDTLRAGSGVAAAATRDGEPRKRRRTRHPRRSKEYRKQQALTALLKAPEEQFSVNDIMLATGMPRSTAREVLKELVSQDAVVLNNENGVARIRYKPGLQVDDPARTKGQGVLP